MPILRIRVQNPPVEFAGRENIELLLQMKDGYQEPVERTGGDLVFETVFEFRPDRGGVPQPVGRAVQHHGDGRRFVYLAWVAGPASGREMFRRIKLFFDQLPTEGETIEVTIQGTDGKGGPACARAVIVE